MKRFLPSSLLLCLLTVLALSVTARAEIIERILVKVNGDIFTKTDLEARQVMVLRQQNPQANDADLKKKVEEVTPQILVDAVDEMLLMQRGKELGYKMTDEQFQDVLKRLKTENKLETEEQFQAALKQENLTVADLRKTIERRMLVERVEQNEVFSHITVNESEERKYYEEHKKEFTSVPTVTLREILVKVVAEAGGVNAGLDGQAKQKAEDIRQRALKGESFDKLAEMSDSPSKSNGGLIGPIERDALDPAFAKILETMKVGEVSPVIRTSSGYDIVKLESATETTVLPFDDARQQVANKIYQAKQQAEFNAYLRKLRASAIIDWKVPELKKLYDEQVTRLNAGPIGVQ